MNIIEDAKNEIRGRRLKIVFPEASDERIRDAAQRIASENLADPILMTEAPTNPTAEEIAAVLRQREHMTEALALRLLRKPLFRAGAMVSCGMAAAMVA